MKRNAAYWQVAGFIFTAVVGTLLHFLFDWTDGNVVAALFSAVNESIWEHIKLLFYPMVAFSLIEYFYWGREGKAFWCVKLAGIVLGMVLVPALYYTYTGALGVQSSWFNITIFFLVAGVVFWTQTKLFQKELACRRGWALAAVLLIAVAFTVLTFTPPHIPLFRDPVTGSFGLHGVK